MNPLRSPASAGQLAGLLRAALGSPGSRQLRSVVRLPGASKKGVYRAAFDDDFTAIVYIWDPGEDYWPVSPGDRRGDHADPFSHACGLDLFEAAHARLTALGVRTPRLYLADSSRRHYPADVAVVEDVPGLTLEDLLGSDSHRGRQVLWHFADGLRVMHAHRGPGFGKVLHVDGGGVPDGGTCEGIVLDRALCDLAEAAGRDARMREVATRTEDTLRRQAGLVRPRSDYTLIHGELGPDHVVLDGHGQPVIVDIEGLMYFDLEWEHVFLQLRFGPDYDLLNRADLDADRLRLYRLAMHLSLVAGPLRLLDGDYPEREFMLEIVESNLGEVLAQLDQ